MKESSTLEIFAWDKFAEEDGDGINLVIMDSKRKCHRDIAGEMLKDYFPARIDTKGIIYYYLTDLEEVWEKSRYIC